MDLQKSLNAPSVVANATGTTPTATLANPTQTAPSPGANLRWYVDGFAVSVSAGPAAAAVITIKDGTTALHIIEWPTTAIGPYSEVLTHPWRCTPGNAATIVVTGGGTATFSVSIWGHVDD